MIFQREKVKRNQLEEKNLKRLKGDNFKEKGGWGDNYRYKGIKIIGKERKKRKSMFNFKLIY